MHSMSGFHIHLVFMLFIGVSLQSFSIFFLLASTSVHLKGDSPLELRIQKRRFDLLLRFQEALLSCIHNVLWKQMPFDAGANACFFKQPKKKKQVLKDSSNVSLNVNSGPGRQESAR